MLHDSQHTAKLKKNPFNWTVILSKSESDVLKHVNVYEQISVQFFPFKMKKLLLSKHDLMNAYVLMLQVTVLKIHNLFHKWFESV